MLALGQSKHQAKFLSTLSLRRATSFDFCIICLPSYFYPRSPCGERQLCEGNRAAEPYFYPRSPCGERLCWFEELDQFDGISIHALLAESDLLQYGSGMYTLISIHALLAESDKAGSYKILHRPEFLSTLSLRRATVKRAVNPLYGKISIHALLAESDLFRLVCNAVPLISIHALLAESDITRILKKATLPISIHALLAESDEQRL